MRKKRIRLHTDVKNKGVIIDITEDVFLLKYIVDDKINEELKVLINNITEV